MANKLTYKNLYLQVDELVDKKLRFSTISTRDKQLGRTSVAPMLTNRVADIGVAELVEAVHTMLKSSLESRIISGLNVTQDDPISDKVKITAGNGVAAGILYTLADDTTITIPFDNTTKIFYINLYLNRIIVDKNSHSDKLSIAKIIVPKPGTTNRVKNRRSDNYELDAYIVNLRKVTLYSDANDNLEEDSIDLLKDSLINPLLASNLVGTINLNENLKISNTQGSINIDSKEIDIKDTSGNILAKFDRRGTFFYDTSGRELARFSSDDARVGNILITKNSIESTNFVSGSSGFRIQDNGNVEFHDGTFRGTLYAGVGEIGGWTIGPNKIHSANIDIDSANNRIQTTDFVSGTLGTGWRIDANVAEFQNIRARGKITTSIFEKTAISSIGGNFLVLGSDILDADMTALDSSTLKITGDITLALNDILRIKDGTDDEWLQVTNIASAPTYSVARDKKGDYAADNNPVWKKGTAVVNYGQSGDGGIYLTASDINAPFISIFDHAGSPWATITNYVRLGNLNGFLGYISDKYGIAIGETTKYLKYDPTNGLQILGSSIVTASSGARLEIFPDSNTGLVIYDDSGNKVLEALVAGANVGDIVFGGTNNYLKWDKSANTLTLRQGALQRIDLDSDGLFFYDNAGTKKFAMYLTSESGGADTGDLTIGDVNANNYIRWDDSLGILTVRGTINADDINVGTLSGIVLQGNVIQTAAAGTRVKLSTDGLIGYDASSNEVFKVVLTGGDVGDVLFGDINQVNGYMQWDASASILKIADVQSPDYVANTTGYKLSATGGLEINTGTIQGTDLIQKLMIYAMMFGK